MLRPKQFLSVILITLLLALGLASCRNEVEPDTGINEEPSQTESGGVIRERTYEDLIAKLEEKGYRVVEEEADQSILQGDRRWLTLEGGENLSVYLYEDSAAMEKDASFLSTDGFTYDNGSQAAKIQWAATPFFKGENVILLYAGQNPAILTALESLMGRQFAGLAS